MKQEKQIRYRLKRMIIDYQRNIEAKISRENAC